MAVAERQRLEAEGRLVVLAQEGTTLRVFAYLPLPPSNGSGRGALRLALSAPDLEDELREQQRAWLGHLAALAAIAVVAVLVLRREQPSAADPAQRALHAYERALESLRDRGERIAADHEVERRRMAGALEEKEAMARAGELTSGIVHEVRNGLGTILGYARLIERVTGEAGSGDPGHSGGSGDEGKAVDAAAAARSIREECQGLEAVVRRFTDFVRLEELRLGVTDLGLLLRRVASHESRGHDEVQIHLTGLDSPLGIGADEELLERAFENLVRNAVQAAERGGRHVWLSVLDAAESYAIRIEDDGPGLPADHPGEIRPFYTTRPGGLGLGLPLAQKIVHLHGGRLHLERRETGGLAVIVVLPRGRAEES